MNEKEKWKWSRSVVSDSSQPHDLQPTKLLRPWDFPGKSTGVGCHCLLHNRVLSNSKKLILMCATTWVKFGNIMQSKGKQTQKDKYWIRSVQFSRSVVSDSLRPHESQHARPPCPSPTPGVHPDSRPSSQWCHPAISSSVVPFSSCPHSVPASESFPMSQLFAWGGQSTGASALASFLPKKSQGWSPSEWTGSST